jgi:N-acetylglucosaminyldiphosphoundecaprenol N-acetyl-beta-D-mannosaminyltransferase
MKSLVLRYTGDGRRQPSGGGTVTAVFDVDQLGTWDDLAYGGHSPLCPSVQPTRERVSLFGVPVDALDMDQTVEAVHGLVACGRPHQHVCLNAAKVVELGRSHQLAAAIASCDLISVDGQAVVWASKILGQPVPERVAGCDLFERLLAEAAATGLRVFLLGARPEVVEAVRDRALERFPGLWIVGARSGYWSTEDEPGVVAEVAASNADLLFVAIPSPRKELFLERHGDALGVPFRMGVGGSFDVFAGVTKRAPRWMQATGLEWSYRLLQEPRRMFKRYLVGNSAFLLLTLRWLLRRPADPVPVAVPLAEKYAGIVVQDAPPPLDSVFLEFGDESVDLPRQLDRHSASDTAAAA